MSITVNGQSCVPPGFRFHPTEEELLNYYLRKKVSCEKIDLDVIRDIDLNKLEPWDIQEECKIGTTPQNDWYFFSHKDKKYPTGTRTNRATAAGFWKATGRDKVIYAGVGRIGMRKTLVFYKGRAPHGQKSEWIMHEYRLDDHLISTASGELAANQEDGWVICRVFKKKIVGSGGGVQQKSFDGDISDGALRQILHHVGRSCKEESSTTTSAAMKLPAWQSPTQAATTLPWLIPDDDCASHQMVHEAEPPAGIANYSAGDGGWSALDRFIASELDHVSQIPHFDQDTAGLSALLCSPPPGFFAMDYHQLQIGDVSLQN